LLYFTVLYLIFLKMSKTEPSDIYSSLGVQRATPFTRSARVPRFNFYLMGRRPTKRGMSGSLLLTFHNTSDIIKSNLT
jgi:hypothetical protein